MEDKKFLGKKTNSNNIRDEELEEINKDINKEKESDDNNGKIPYYCALCGHKVILSSISFDSLPHRRVDDAIICLLKDNNIENLLVKDKYIVIRRGKNRYEKQYTFKCPNCSILVAYQSMDFEEDNQETKNKEIVLELLDKKEKKILYILNDSTIDNPSYSLLQNEIEKIENGKALNLEQSKKIYINNMKLRKKK
jgi:predicted RNA-binding Zn-ribbon protein involved in translation (DUF1610 family)